MSPMELVSIICSNQTIALDVYFSSHSEPYVPYSVSVSANSSVGVGESVEVTVFTLDGSI